MEYAVRGKIAIEADRISKELAEGTSKFPFDHIIYTNIGNPHAVQQKAITWPRQVMALLQLPDALGIDHPNASQNLKFVLEKFQETNTSIHDA